MAYLAKEDRLRIENVLNAGVTVNRKTECTGKKVFGASGLAKGKVSSVLQGWIMGQNGV